MLHLYLFSSGYFVLVTVGRGWVCTFIIGPHLHWHRALALVSVSSSEVMKLYRLHEKSKKVIEETY